MSAASFIQQRAITALLETMLELANITVLATFRGDTTSQLDAALAGMGSESKKGGASIVVMQPSEAPHDEEVQIPLLKRVHLVRVIELPTVNQMADGTFLCGLTCDDIKDLVIQRLHNRHLGWAMLQLGPIAPYQDELGGVGYDVKFNITGQLAAEYRHVPPTYGITASGADFIVTLTGTGAAGEELYLTTDGSAPVPGDARRLYSGPVTVAAGTTLLAAAIATGKAISDFHQHTV